MGRPARGRSCAEHPAVVPERDAGEPAPGASSMRAVSLSAACDGHECLRADVGDAVALGVGAAGTRIPGEVGAETVRCAEARTLAQQHEDEPARAAARRSRRRARPGPARPRSPARAAIRRQRGGARARRATARRAAGPRGRRARRRRRARHRRPSRPPSPRGPSAIGVESAAEVGPLEIRRAVGSRAPHRDALEADARQCSAQMRGRRAGRAPHRAHGRGRAESRDGRGWADWSRRARARCGPV